MDEIDRKILNLLQMNDKISYHKLKKKVKMAASTIHNRVNKMKNSGIIKSFSAIVNPEKVGYNAIAVLGLSVEPTKIKEVADFISAFDESQLVTVTTGDHDIIAQIIAEDEKSLWRFINEKIKTINGVSKEMDVSSFIDIHKMSHFIKL